MRPINLKEIGLSATKMMSVIRTLPESETRTVLQEEFEFLTRILSRFRREGTTGAGDIFEQIAREPRKDIGFSARPTFIIGNIRSGTTLLSWLLDSHPNIACGPETNLCSFASMAVPEGPTIFDYLAAQLEPLGETRNQLGNRFARLIDSVFHDYAVRRGKKRWVDKELFVSDSYHLIDAIFGYNAQYIFIARHGLDAALSAAEAERLRHEHVRGHPLVIELRRWVASNENAMDFMELNPKRVHFVRYEDLVTDPKLTAQRIFEFLEEPFIDTILDDMKRVPHEPHVDAAGDTKIQMTGGNIDATRRNYWREWPQELIAQVARIANPTLLRLGYEPVPTSSATQQPSHVRGV